MLQRDEIRAAVCQRLSDLYQFSTLMVRTLVASLFILFGCTQLAVSADYTDTGTSTSYSLNAGDTLTITGGTYTGSINGPANGATVTVKSGASFVPSSLNNVAGAFVVESGGSISLPSISLGAGFSLDNSGTTSFLDSLNFNGTSTFTNQTGGIINYNKTFQLGANSTMVNDGEMNFSFDFNTSSGTNLTNNGEVNAANFNPGGVFVNNGHIEANEFINVNSSSDTTNYCSFISYKGFNNNSHQFVNHGIIFDQGTSDPVRFNANTYNGATALIRGADFYNNAMVSGGGSYWFSDETLTQGNFGDDNDGIVTTFYDDSQTGSQLFDTQNGAVGDASQVVRNYFAPIDIDYARTYCDSSATAPSSCEVIPSGEPTAAILASDLTWNLTDGVLESIEIAGEADPFDGFITADTIAYSFTNVGANNQKIVNRDGGSTVNITDGSAVFDPAILAAVSDRHLSHYLQLDNGIVSTDYFEFLYNDPIKAAGNRYVVLTERRGNNTISAQAIDANGNLIGNAVIASGGSYIDTGYDEEAKGQDLMGYVYPLTALVSSGTEIHGIRYTQSGATGRDGGDGKVFIMVDSSQACGRGEGSSAPAEYDYGDAPVSGTSPNGSDNNAYGEASHTIANDLYLGASAPDADATNQPDPDAAGDDSDGSDDDDGIVNFSSLTTSGTAYTIAKEDITAHGSGTLHAWIDFDGDGSFESSEHASSTVTADVVDNDLSWTGQSVMSNTGKTFVRFRLTSDVAITHETPTGLASDGEVEDYPITVIDSCEVIPSGEPTAAIAHSDLTWNMNDGILESIAIAGETDLFDGFITADSIAYRFSNVGASNQKIVNRDGSSTVNITDGSAVFDPAILAAVSDRHLGHYLQLDNGIVSTDYFEFLYNDPVLAAGNRYVVLTERLGNNTVSAQALDANGNLIGTAVIATRLSYSGTGYVEKAHKQEVKGYVYPLTALVPSGTEIHGIRYTQSGATGKDGGDGKVFIMLDSSQACGRGEGGGDIVEYDYGDAPATYGTTKAANGAEHIISSDIFLGSAPDGEVDGVPSATADNDDSIGVADEDGVSVLAILSVTDSRYQLTVNATNTTANAGRLIAWIDFDGNGQFDMDEAAARVVPAGTSAEDVLVTWSNIPVDIQAGASYLRLRFTSDALNASEATGAKSDGEVEDYALTISSAGLAVSGRVYIDSNSNETNEASESGIGGTVVVLRDFFTGECRSTRTSGNGDYQFAEVVDGSYQIYQAHGETSPVPQSCGTEYANNPTAYQSTTDDILTVTVAGSDLNNQDFGEVAGAETSTSTGTGITFEPDQQSEILPGSVVFYDHVFTTEADGSVVFNTNANGNTAAGWSSILYRDTNCDGVLSAGEQGVQLAPTSIDMVAGERICLINKVYAPSNAPAQDRYTVETVATFSYLNTDLPDIALSVSDLTITGQPVTPTTSSVAPAVGVSRLELTKTVENLTAVALQGLSEGDLESSNQNQASPGDVLKYRIYYRNTGTGPITDLDVNDVVPDYTELVANSVGCGDTPTGLVCGTPIVNSSDIHWVFTGTLNGGASGLVSYEVTVDQ